MPCACAEEICASGSISKNHQHTNLNKCGKFHACIWNSTILALSRLASSLAVDNLLKPKRKHLGEDFHQMALQEQHKSFVHVRNHLKKAKKRQAKYVNKGSKAVEFQEVDALYNKKQRGGKLGKKWKPFYRIIEKTGPV